MAESKEGIFCDACGVDCRNYPGMDFTVGMNVQMPQDSREGKRLKGMFGKSDFKVCCACVLQAFGVRPVNDLPETNEVPPVEKKRVGRPPKEKAIV